MLTRLPFVKESLPLKTYVVATCFQKILSRVSHVLSRPFMKSLQEVKSFEFDESIKSTSRSTTDRQFLKSFMPDFMEWKGGETKFPQIMKGAEESTGEGCLYSRDTCMEFHELLVELLVAFKPLLVMLTELDKLLLSDEANEANGKKFRGCLATIVLIGYGLHLLSKSAALDMHLQIIELHLRDKLKSDDAPTTMDTLGSGNDLGNADAAPVKVDIPDRSEDEPDDALEAVQPSVKVDGVAMPLWRSYKEWMKLLLSHFDSADTLVNFVQERRLKSLSCEMLVGTKVDKDYLPWRELFKMIFPTQYKTAASRINKEIFQHLESAARLDEAKSKESTRHLSQALEASRRHDLARTKDELRLMLPESELPSWKGRVRMLLEQLDGRDGNSRLMNGDKLANATPFEGPLHVPDTLQSMLDTLPFYRFLQIAETGKWGFSGTMHCEACLCSLLRYVKGRLNILGLEDIREKLKVCYIAFNYSSDPNRCCIEVFTDYWHFEALLPSMLASPLPPDWKCL
jgi:hypothetical protein